MRSTTVTLRLPSSSPSRPTIVSTLDNGIPSFLDGGGDMGARIRAYDWASHPLGPPRQWPGALQMAVSLCLHSHFPTAVYWGLDLHVLYNDAWSVIPAERHPAALGRKGAELWADIWAEVGPEFARALQGEGAAHYEVMLPMVRSGVPRETWWNYSVTPIRNADGTVGGVFNQGNEITDNVLHRRARLAEIERWRELFRQAPAPIAWLRGPAHTFEIVNDAYLRLVGGRDVVGKTVLDALPEIAAQGFVRLLDDVYRTGQPYIGTGIPVNLQQDGGTEERIVDFIYQPSRNAAGDVDGILVVVTDVTERTRAEAALRQSNWLLGEERAKLTIMVEAEQRAREALSRALEMNRAFNVRPNEP